MAVDAFNRYLAARTALTSPSILALEFARVDRTHSARTITEQQSSPEGGGPATVTLTLDGLPDDSVRSIRYVLHFDPDGSGWKLKSALWSQRCRIDRGPAAFSPEGCV